MTDNTETEFKLRATDHIEIASIDAALREASAETPHRASQHHLDIYLDDERSSLQRAGIGLRLRTTGQKRKLTIKTRARPKNGLFVRQEVEADWTGDDVPGRARELPRVLRDLIEPFCLDRTLVQHLRLEVEREIRQLSNAGNAVCELAADRVTAHANGRSAQFQEVELEVLGELAWSKDLAKTLRERLPLEWAKRDKPTHATSLLGAQRKQRARSDDWDQPITTRIAQALEAHLQTLRAAEACVRGYDDAAARKTMRVTARRMHHLVQAFRELWAKDVGHRLLSTLAETGRRLELVHELDVTLDHLAENSAQLPPQLASAAEHVSRCMQRHREHAFEQLSEWLRSDDRLADANSLDDGIQALGREQATSVSSRTAATAALAAATRAFRERLAQLADGRLDGASHRLLQAGVQLCDLAREFERLPKHSITEPRRTIKRALRNLRRACEHETASGRLLGWVHQIAGSSTDPSWTAAAIGGLATNHRQASLGLMAVAASEWEHCDRKRLWRKLPG